MAGADRVETCIAASKGSFHHPLKTSRDDASVWDRFREPLLQGFGERNTKFLHAFLEALRKNYDVVLTILPPQPTSFRKIMMDASDLWLFVRTDSESAQTTPLPEQHDSARLKTYCVELTEGASLPGGSSRNYLRIPWKSTFELDVQRNRSPFIKNEAQTQKYLDRLARELGDMSIGFAMGSGAAYGYALIGMLKVLERHGIYPDIIAGTSIGALMGSFYAYGISPEDLEQIALEITKKKILSLMDFTLPWQGLIIGRQVQKFLKIRLGGRHLRQPAHPVPLRSHGYSHGRRIDLEKWPCRRSSARVSVASLFISTLFSRRTVSCGWRTGEPCPHIHNRFHGSRYSYFF